MRISKVQKAENRGDTLAPLVRMERKETPQERYTKEHCVRFTLKLNKKTDADIIAALEGKPKQTEAKRLIRVALEK